MNPRGFDNLCFARKLKEKSFSEKVEELKDAIVSYENIKECQNVINSTTGSVIIKIHDKEILFDLSDLLKTTLLNQLRIEEIEAQEEILKIQELF